MFWSTSAYPRKGRAQFCQGWGRGFESLRPLQYDWSLFGALNHDIARASRHLKRANLLELRLGSVSCFNLKSGILTNPDALEFELPWPPSGQLINSQQTGCNWTEGPKGRPRSANPVSMTPVGLFGYPHLDRRHHPGIRTAILAPAVIRAG